MDLTRGRQNGMSINPISWPQIEAWASLRKITPMQWELDALLGIDSAQIHSVLEDQDKPKPKK